MAHDDNVFRVEIQALDPTFGYNMSGLIQTTDGQGVKTRTQINEHYDTEAEVDTRLQSGWAAFAAVVDSE